MPNDSPVYSTETILWVERLLAASQALTVLARGDNELQAALFDYVDFQLGNHALGQGKYSSLASALSYLGKTILYPGIAKALSTAPTPAKVAEFGPGTGWLLQMLYQKSYYSPAPPFFAVDKRRLWVGPQDFLEKASFSHDLEDSSDLTSVVQLLEPSPSEELLILANNFLHCVDNPSEIVRAFYPASWLVVEPTEGDDAKLDFPYRERQLRLFGSTPMTWKEIDDLFNCLGYTPRFASVAPLGQGIALYCAPHSSEAHS